MTGSVPESGPASDYYLDITKEVCPMTFVRAKLLIERMPAGATATIRLIGAEPLVNVPRAVREHGHEVVSLEPEDASAADGPHRLAIRKSAA